MRAIGAALGVAAWAAAAEGAPAKIGLGDLTRPQAARAIFRTCSLCSENSGLMGFLRERVEPGGFGERVRVKWVPGEEPELSVVAENMSPLAVYRVGSLGSGEVEQLLAEWGFPPKAPPGHGGDTQGGGGHGQDMLRGGGGFPSLASLSLWPAALLAQLVPRNAQERDKSFQWQAKATSRALNIAPKG